MELIITKAELSKVLLVTQSIVEKKTTMPILANILLSATEGMLKVSSSDLEITAVASAKCKVKKAGSTTVSAKTFSEIVRELPDTDITLKLTENERLEITTSKSRFKMMGLSAEEYPSLPGLSIVCSSRVDGAVLSEMIANTIYAVSLDEMRFNLSGVCFEAIAGGKKGSSELRLVATDGHRLAMVTREMTIDFSERVIVPRKGLIEVRKMLEANGPGSVAFAIKEGFFVVETGSAKFTMRLIDGEFPDYQPVLPEQKGDLAIMPIKEVAQSLRRVALMVTDKGKCVRLDFNQGTLKILSSSPELGEASEELQIDYTGPDLSVGFNAKYILDICSSIGEERSLVIELHGEEGPGKFYPQDDESYVSVVMPMRL